MTSHQEFPELNYVTFTGRVLNKDNLSLSKYDIYVIRFRVENTQTFLGGRETRRQVSDLVVEAWGKLAEDVDRQIQVGSAVLIEGTLVSRSFEDRMKATHHRISVKASSVNILDARS